MSPKIRYLGFSFRPRSFDQAPLRIPGTVVWYSSPFGRLNWATTGSNLGPTRKTETRAQDDVFLEVRNFNVQDMCSFRALRSSTFFFVFVEKLLHPEEDMMGPASLTHRNRGTCPGAG